MVRSNSHILLRSWSALCTTSLPSSSWSSIFPYRWEAGSSDLPLPEDPHRISGGLRVSPEKIPGSFSLCGHWTRTAVYAGRRWSGTHREDSPHSAGELAYAVPVTYREGNDHQVNPSVGRVVHYVSHGTPLRVDGSQAYSSECRAATVTGVNEDGTVCLAVFNPSGLFFHASVMADHTESQTGTWHWPERAG
jgi:hypothetical protein